MKSLKSKTIRTTSVESNAIVDNLRANQQSRTGGADETKQILKDRARVLAQELKPIVDGKDNTIEVVEFELAYEKYAFESRFIDEVYPLKDITPLPCTPPYVIGIINVRGQIISVIDIKKFFELPEKGLTNLNKVIILRSESMEFGILADLIIGTQLIAMSALQASLPTLTGIRNEYLMGITPERMVVLDAAKLLADTSIVVQEQV
jgi:purine-binding chemotaxis protein CheW